MAKRGTKPLYGERMVTQGFTVPIFMLKALDELAERRSTGRATILRRLIAEELRRSEAELSPSGLVD